MSRIFLVAIMMGAMCACASFPEAPAATQTPRISDDTFVSLDGARLGLTTWAAETPQAVIVAVHGMNDYAQSFALAADWWAREANLTTYAYDQRGFGRSPHKGRWLGADAMRNDLRAAIEAAREKHPSLPIYAAGHSMGAAVVLSAMGENRLPVNGVILAAPGVWGGSQMPILYRLSANIAATAAPGKTLTGERAARQATDNIDVLRAMQADENVIKETRLDAVLGVTRIMGEAYDASDEAGGDILFLYGEKDEIIPVKSMRRAAARLCGEVDVRVYQQGWHLLFRDLQAEAVWRDAAAWIEQRNAAGPSLGAGPAAYSCVGGGPMQVSVAAPARSGEKRITGIELELGVQPQQHNQ